MNTWAMSVVDERQWSVFLMVNVAPHARGHSEIWLHQYPEVILFLRNQFADRSRYRWVIVMQIDGFRTVGEASRFYTMWRSRTRRLDRYIAKGYYTFRQHASLFPGTCLTVSPYYKHEWIVHMSHPTPDSSTTTPTSTRPTESRRGYDMIPLWPAGVPVPSEEELSSRVYAYDVVCECFHPTYVDQLELTPRPALLEIVL